MDYLNISRMFWVASLVLLSSCLAPVSPTATPLPTGTAATVDTQGALALRVYSAAPLDGRRTEERYPDVVVFPDGRAVANTSGYPPDLPPEWREYQLTDDEMSTLGDLLKRLARDRTDDAAQIPRSDQGMTIIWAEIAPGHGLEFTTLGLDTSVGAPPAGISAAVADLDLFLHQIKNQARGGKRLTSDVERELPKVMVAPFG